jgi:hypothetical protein
MILGYIFNKYNSLIIENQILQEDFESIEYELKNGTVESLMIAMDNSNFKKKN